LKLSGLNLIVKRFGFSCPKIWMCTILQLSGNNEWRGHVSYVIQWLLHYVCAMAAVSLCTECVYSCHVLYFPRLPTSKPTILCVMFISQTQSQLTIRTIAPRFAHWMFSRILSLFYSAHVTAMKLCVRIASCSVCVVCIHSFALSIRAVVAVLNVVHHQQNHQVSTQWRNCHIMCLFVCVCVCMCACVFHCVILRHEKWRTGTHLIIHHSRVRICSFSVLLTHSHTPPPRWWFAWTWHISLSLGCESWSTQQRQFALFSTFEIRLRRITNKEREKAEGGPCSCLLILVSRDSRKS